MSAQITDKDNGYAAAVERTRELKKARPWVKIGVDSRPHDPSGVPTDELGFAHEFGDGHVPQRSFLRGWTSDAQRMASLSDISYRLMEAYLAGHVSLHDALAAIGSWCVANVRQRIRLHIPPPLNRQTIDRKNKEQSPTPVLPLVDSGQLEEAIIYEASR